jgi:hypothetical protein
MTIHSTGMPRRGSLRFVELEVARAARGLRLVLITALPSPWSEGARALFALKGVDALGVAFRPGDAALAAWAGVPNAPAVLLDDEPPASGWEDILALAERLCPEPVLVPAAPATRARFFAWMHALLDPSGLAACRRQLVLHESLRPDEPGHIRRGFPPGLARLLAARYGYQPDRVPEARDRLIAGLVELDAALGDSARKGSPYILGELTALDLYAAATVATLAPLPDELHPIAPSLRPALEYLDPAVAAALTPPLRAHRDLVYAAHIHDPRPAAQKVAAPVLR